MSSQLHDTLVRYSPDWKLGPGIAESWTQPDDMTIVYTIRQDAKFWDGNPVTADDVVFSLKRHMDPEDGLDLGRLLQQRQEHHRRPAPGR